MADVKEFRSKTAEELKAELTAKQREYVEMKRTHAAGELTNPRQLRALRRDIARINTVISEPKANDAKENE